MKPLKMCCFPPSPIFDKEKLAETIENCDSKSPCPSRFTYPNTDNGALQ